MMAWYSIESYQSWNAARSANLITTKPWPGWFPFDRLGLARAHEHVDVAIFQRVANNGKVRA